MAEEEAGGEVEVGEGEEGMVAAVATLDRDKTSNLKLNIIHCSS